MVGRYTGPYNDLENQVTYDTTMGEILQINDQPTGKTDAISMPRDVDYFHLQRRPKVQK